MMNVSTLANHRHSTTISYFLILLSTSVGKFILSLLARRCPLFQFAKPKCLTEFALFIIFSEIKYILDIFLVAKTSLK